MLPFPRVNLHWQVKRLRSDRQNSLQGYSNHLLIYSKHCRYHEVRTKSELHIKIPEG
ncbi:hypothetical protein [Dendronalium sp. ChiSLP03b]|uniref:hypothetical protein n=1 Tax=Dendronalium sp. ChiSLP03b TaxID=3075381 RepID=UPI002AD8D00A|nr:hypothetical protein [Dendronalium sp. ChiSLP03b]